MPQTINAKFRCRSVEQVDGSPILENVKLQAIQADSPINKQWSKWTPSGELTMAISNVEAQGSIVAGKDYIITIREAAEGE